MTRGRRIGSAQAIAAATLCSIGCASPGLNVVPRYPFVEDQGLALVQEELNLRVEPNNSVHVEALLQFETRGPAKNRVASFPIAGPRGASQQFRAEILGPAPRKVQVARGAAGQLPVGSVTETWDLWLQAEDFRQPKSWLAVYYLQPGAGDFAYVLKSGAYWDGPIRTLRVSVRDEHKRLAAIVVEGERVPTRGRTQLALSLRDVEPDDGVKLEWRR